MHRVIRTVLAGVLLAAACAVHAAPPVPLLWTLTRGGHTVYLLGSFHLLRDSDYPLAPSVDAAFADAEALVFEVPQAELDSPQASALAMSLARFEGGGTLAAALSTRQRDALQQALSARGLTPAQVDAFEPWFVNLMLMTGMADAYGFKAEYGLDRRLMQRAAQARKPARGLETVASQLKALDGTPLGEQVASLDEMLADPARSRAELDALHRAWRAGDAATLDRLALQRMRRDTPRTFDALLVRRNQAWLPQIEALLRGPGTDDALIVVGAMHLLGREGLVEQLRRRGYQVTRTGR